MLNKIIDLSLKNRVFVLIISVFVMLSGLYLASNMDVDVFPDLTAPTVAVITEAHGMATEEVERMVSYPVESSMNGSPNVRRIRSSSSRGLSIVWVEFEWGTDIYKARQIVSEKLSTITDVLPQSVGKPTLAPISSVMGEIMLLSVVSDSLNPMELRTLSDWNIRQRLLAVEGVSQVVVVGGGYKQYQIQASPEKMNYYQVSLKELEDAAIASNINATGGVLSNFGSQYIIRGEGKTNKTEDIGASLIKLVDGVPIKIEDVADVLIAEASKIGDGSYMGEDAVILTVLKQPNANTLDLTQRIDEALVDLRKGIPETVHIDGHIFRQADFIQASINNLQKTLLEGAFFVSIVLFLFLMNWRTTAISLVAIPISLLVTIIVMKLLGFTINTMSLGGMAIAIGALVDDAIIDVENIFKRLKQNALLAEGQRKSTLRIVFDASKEIRNSILIATLIIVVSFIPLFLLTGMEGRLLQPLGVSFIVALLTSLIVAVTVTPVLSSYLLSSTESLVKQAKGSRVEQWFQKAYGSVLQLFMRRPKLVIFTTICGFVVAIVMLSSLGRSFLPAFNEGSLVISVISPPGTSLEESNKVGRQAEQILLSMDEINVVSRRTGRAELDEHAQGVNSSEIETPFTLIDGDKEGFLQAVREKLAVLPGVNITIGQPIAHRIDHMLSGTRANIAIKVFGTELNELFRIGNAIKSNIVDVDGLVDVNVEQQIEVPQIRVKPKRQLLARYGLQVADVMRLVDIAFGGEVVSQVYEGQRSFDLLLRYEVDNRSTIEQLRETQIDVLGGQKIPLHYIADISILGSPYAVSRENVQRKIVVSANVAERDLRGAVNEVKSILDAKIKLPEGYRLAFGGQFENEERASSLLLWSSVGAIFIIFLLLYMEFKDLSLAGMVLLNLPLALIGGVFIVYFTSGIISIASTIGFISLFGIATRNGILLISRYQVLRNQGVSLYDCVMQGSLDRLNPILMTALTTGLALIPLAMAGNKAGNEIQSPMAVVILGGLFSATLLNIMVVPAIYYLLNKRRYV